MAQKVAIDIGACQGRFIDIALRGGMTVHAFEPNPTLAKQLSEKYPNVIVNQAAAWDGDGTARLYLHRAKNIDGSSLIAAKSNVGEDYIEVPTVTIGKYLQQFSHVHVIKIDAEGAEYRIIESILNHYGHEKIDRWLVEDHERKIADKAWKDHKQEVLQQLKDRSLKLFNWQ